MTGTTLIDFFSLLHFIEGFASKTTNEYQYGYFC